MSYDLVTVATYGNMVAAHAARSRLEAAGIRAFVAGENAASALSYVGPALGGVKLQVGESDLERAAELLAEDDEADAAAEAAGPWRCRPCQEVVDASFQVCWACGLPREDVEDETFGAEKTTRSIPSDRVEGPFAENRPGGDAGAELVRPAFEDGGHESENPYASPRDPDAPLPSKRIEILDKDAEQAVLRAYRAALIGLVLCPGVTHLFSFAMLILIAGRREKLTPKSKRRFYIAYAVNIMGMITLIMLLQIGSDGWWLHDLTSNWFEWW